MEYGLALFLMVSVGPRSNFTGIKRGEHKTQLVTGYESLLLEEILAVSEKER